MEVINLGLQLSEALKDVPQSQRTDALRPLIDRLIADHGVDIILDRIDILFDPQWRIDILKLLLSAGRNRRLYILWPGTIASTALEYSLPGRPDHRRYNIADYSDAYIVLK